MSSQDNILSTMMGSMRTVFTLQTLLMMTECKDSQKLTKSLHYYAHKGKLLNLRKGVYAKPNYNVQEMACCLFHPSYISLEYVLSRAGVIFQWDDTIDSISYLNRRVEVDGHNYQFRKINPVIWIGMEGIEQRDNVTIASAERAFLDMLYLSAGNCYFDNLNPLSITKVRKLLPLYRSAKLSERVAALLNIKL